MSFFNIFSFGGLFSSTESDNSYLDDAIRELRISPEKKTFTVNGFISPKNSQYFLADIGSSNRELYEHVLAGRYVALFGPRAAGKTTRMERACIDLKMYGLRTVNISFQVVYEANMTAASFWKSLNIALLEKYMGSTYSIPEEIVESGKGFRHLINLLAINGKKVVMFLDEFDMIAGNTDVQNAFLSFLRGVKQEDHTKNHLLSVVVIGVFGVQHIDSASGSPFNVPESVEAPRLTLEEVRSMAQEYMIIRRVEIEDEVLEDIVDRCGGHAGFISMCFKGIDEQYFRQSVNQRLLNFNKWVQFYNTQCKIWVKGFSSIRRLIEEVKSNQDLRSFLVRSVLVKESIARQEDDSCYKTLLRLGIIVETIEGNSHRPRAEVASRFLRQVLFQEVSHKDNIPLTIPEEKLFADPFTLNMRDGLIAALQLLSKDLLVDALRHMTKMHNNQVVIHEYFYHCYLLIALKNSLHPDNWSIYMEAKKSGSKKRVDIMVVRDDEDPNPSNRYVIELMSTDNHTAQREHIERTKSYSEMFNANHKWMLHIFCGNVNAETHAKATAEQGVHVLLACHSKEGEWTGFFHAAPGKEFESIELL